MEKTYIYSITINKEILLNKREACFPCILVDSIRIYPHDLKNVEIKTIYELQNAPQCKFKELWNMLTKGTCIKERTKIADLPLNHYGYMTDWQYNNVDGLCIYYELDTFKSGTVDHKVTRLKDGFKIEGPKHNGFISLKLQ